MLIKAKGVTVYPTQLYTYLVFKIQSIFMFHVKLENSHQ